MITNTAAQKAEESAKVSISVQVTIDPDEDGPTLIITETPPPAKGLHFLGPIKELTAGYESFAL